MAIKRSALGKGLGALITENTSLDTKNSVIEVDINKIEPGIGQPRKNFNKEKLINKMKSLENENTLVITNNSNINLFQNAIGYGTSLEDISHNIFKLLRQIDLLSESHFLLMIDDAHDMNEYQIRALNSWIAYRDHSLFSFKIAFSTPRPRFP